MRRDANGAPTKGGPTDLEGRGTGVGKCGREIPRFIQCRRAAAEHALSAKTKPHGMTSNAKPGKKKQILRASALRMTDEGKGERKRNSGSFGDAIFQAPQGCSGAHPVVRARYVREARIASRMTAQKRGTNGG